MHEKVLSIFFSFSSILLSYHLFFRRFHARVARNQLQYLKKVKAEKDDSSSPSSPPSSPSSSEKPKQSALLGKLFMLFNFLFSFVPFYNLFFIEAEKKEENFDYDKDLAAQADSAIEKFQWFF